MTQMMNYQSQTDKMMRHIFACMVFILFMPACQNDSTSNNDSDTASSNPGDDCECDTGDQCDTSVDSEEPEDTSETTDTGGSEDTGTGSDVDTVTDTETDTETDTGTETDDSDSGLPADAAFTVQLVPSDGEPLEDISVLYAGPDGVQLEISQTDATGLAAFDNVPAGGFVTVLFINIGQSIDQNIIHTVGGVQDGDQIQIAGAAPATVDDIVGGYSIATSNLPAGTTDVEMGAGDGQWNEDNLLPPTFTGDLLSRNKTSADGYSALAIAYNSGGSLVGIGHILDATPSGAVPSLQLDGTIDTWNETPGQMPVSLQNDTTLELELELDFVAMRQGQVYLPKVNATLDDAAPTDIIGISNYVDALFHSDAIAEASIRDVAYWTHRFSDIKMRTSAIPADAVTQPITWLASDLMSLDADLAFDLMNYTITLDEVAPPTCGTISASMVSALVFLTPVHDGRAFMWIYNGPYQASTSLPDVQEAISLLDQPDVLIPAVWYFRAEGYSLTNYEQRKNEIFYSRDYSFEDLIPARQLKLDETGCTTSRQALQGF